MVYIEVDDCNPLNFTPILGHSVASSHGNVVNEAETIAAGLVGIIVMESLSKNTRMMSGWPGCAKRIPVLSTHYCINSLHCCTCREQCKLDFNIINVYGNLTIVFIKE